jgi:hypothetical protein
MYEVFINYRTGDGDEAAVLLESKLSARFGEGRFFRAATSIPPGELYPQRLLNAVRRSEVLLAVMSPDWPHFPQLRDDTDWVRREILEAYAYGIRVIPVLKGRKTDRLNAADLPAELARLADVQSLRLDMRDNGADIVRIGDELADLVPALKEADHAQRALIREATHNSVGTARGTVVQGSNVTGDIGTVIKGNHGPVHAGKGDIYQDSQHFTGYIESDSHAETDRGEKDQR